MEVVVNCIFAAMSQELGDQVPERHKARINLLLIAVWVRIIISSLQLLTYVNLLANLLHLALHVRMEGRPADLRKSCRRRKFDRISVLVQLTLRVGLLLAIPGQ